MLFLNPNVISKKIQHKNSLLRTKAFVASFGIHSALFASVAYLMITHPIPLPQSEETIVISLAEFNSDSGDIHRLESLPHEVKTPKPTPKKQPQKVEKADTSPIAKTPLERPSLTPSVSPEASAPLAQSLTPASTPPTLRFNDSPHLTQTQSEKELPRNPVSDNQLGGAALGHIRTMIENAITYPSIARKLRLEGVVLVTFILKPDGTVDTAHIKSTSGSSVLDSKAIQTILSLSGDYPSLGKTFELSIPIAFNLHKS